MRNPEDMLVEQIKAKIKVAHDLNLKAKALNDRSSEILAESRKLMDEARVLHSLIPKEQL